jgi:hypothetical protein
MLRFPLQRNNNTTKFAMIGVTGGGARDRHGAVPWLPLLKDAKAVKDFLCEANARAARLSYRDHLSRSSRRWINGPKERGFVHEANALTGPQPR